MIRHVFDVVLDHLVLHVGHILSILLALMAPAGSQVFTPEQFGAAGDCVTDDTAALMAMRSAAAAAQGSGVAPIIYKLSAGRCYQYGASNTLTPWTWGIRNLWVQGNGAYLANIANFNVCGSDCAYPIVTNRSVFEMQAPGAAMAITTPSQTFLVQDAASGATSVTLQSAGDASNFAVGGNLLIYSYNQQFEGGYPPNARYFDYVKITSIVGAVLNFTPALQNNHSASFPENVNDIVGRARAFPIDSGGTPWGISLLIQNVTVISNPNALRPADMGYSDPAYRSHNYNLMLGFGSITVENLVGDYIVISTMGPGSIDIRDSHYFGSTPDKLVPTINYINTTIDYQVGECTGINVINFFNSSSGQITCPPRKIYFSGHTFNTPGQVSPPSIDLNNSGFPGVGFVLYSVFNGGGGASTPIGPNNVVESVTVDGTNVTTTTNGITAEVTFADMQRLLRCTVPGGLITLTRSGTPTVGTVAGITGTYAGPNFAIVTMAGVPQPQTSDVISCFPVTHGGIVAVGNTYNNYGGAPSLP